MSYCLNLHLYELKLIFHTIAQIIKSDLIKWDMGVSMNYLNSIFGLEGKIALVTGGATGIGRMIANALVMGGARVMIASRKGEDCAKVADELNGLEGQGSAEGFAGDVSTEEGLGALTKAVKSRSDKLDILVNNAGISWGAPYEDFPYSAWEKVMNINVAAMFTLTRDLTPLLAKAASHEDPARVLNLGSVMGSYPLADGAYSYAVSKAGVHHMTKILAKDLAAKRITVNAFAPGPFPSKMTAFVTAKEEGVRAINEGNPLGRLGCEDDIAGATLFLCGKGGAYTTGAILPIDGGISVMTHPDALFPDV
jgi:NAD(P)-dependent dehydrogenase (short-subunit alcohol dehydrogenase family)